MSQTWAYLSPKTLLFTTLRPNQRMSDLLLGHRNKVNLKIEETHSHKRVKMVWGLVLNKYRPLFIPVFYCYITTRPQARHGQRCLLAKMEMMPTGHSKTWAYSISHLKDGVASPVLSSWPNTAVLEEVTSLPDPLVTWGAPWNQLSEQQREFIHFKDDSATVISDELCFLFVRFNP